MTSLARILGLIATAFAVTPTATADDTSYYFFNGRELQRVTHGRPEEVVAQEWQFWLFKKGAATSGRNYWGIISGRSVAAIRTELLHSQEFEKRWEKWCDCSWGDETNFNPLGPIAVVDAPLVPTASKVFEVGERLAKLRKTLGTINAIITPRGNANPFADVGRDFREYVDNLKDAQGKLRQLRRLMNDTSGPPLNAAFADLDLLTGQVENATPQVLRAIDVAYPQQSASAWTSSDVRQPDGTMIRQTVAVEGERITVKLIANNSDSATTQRTFTFSARNVASDQIRVRIDRSGWLVAVPAPGRQITDVTASSDGTITAHVSTIDLVFSSEISAQAAATALASLSLAARTQRSGE